MRPTLLLLLCAALLPACGEREAIAEAVPGGDPERGEELQRLYGCGSCHTIPGVLGADAKAGPPLTAWARRDFIAGTLQNTPENLILWIMEPQSIEPGTAMPDMGVTREDARDIAAYLYALE